MSEMNAKDQEFQKRLQVIFRDEADGHLRAGASGYILKQAAHEELFTAIRAVYRNDVFLSPSVSKKVVDIYIQSNKSVIMESSVLEKLTPREREVLQLIAEGK